MSANSVTTENPSKIQEAFAPVRSYSIVMLLFSSFINILQLTGSVFMLLVYDRVLPTRSVETLVALIALMAMLYLFLGGLDLMRSRILMRFGARIDAILRGVVFRQVMNMSITAKGGSTTQPLQDLHAIRTFFSNLGPAAILDLPWVFIYLALLFMLHWIFLVMGIIAAIILFSLTFIQDLLTRKGVWSAAKEQAQADALLHAGRNNAEAVMAMGMAKSVIHRWMIIQEKSVSKTLNNAKIAGSLSTITKVFRMFLQSLVLGVGAYLAIYNITTPGIMIAASIIMSRALAPIEQSIANWRSFISARQGYYRLRELLRNITTAERLPLPPPSNNVAVENLVVVPPGSRKPSLYNINFGLKLGDGLGVIGPSASGKSSLAKALTGIWRATNGSVRFDNSGIDQWEPDVLGKYVGYLPQDVELFQGTIAENISRFDPEPLPEKIIEAAEIANVDHMIRMLPDGYDTVIGASGVLLSGGQRQRVALARAIYKDPFIVVLDEPNSNLDTEGEQALTKAIATLRAKNCIVVVMAHRSSALASIDQLLFLIEGRQAALGPKEEILKQIANASGAGTPPSGKTIRTITDSPAAN